MGPFKYAPYGARGFGAGVTVGGVETTVIVVSGNVFPRDRWAQGHRYFEIVVAGNNCATHPQPPPGAMIIVRVGSRAVAQNENLRDLPLAASAMTILSS
jgi:hypothetical protein